MDKTLGLITSTEKKKEREREREREEGREERKLLCQFLEAIYHKAKIQKAITFLTPAINK
jgi:hypothetical protein